MIVVPPPTLFLFTHDATHTSAVDLPHFTPATIKHPPAKRWELLENSSHSADLACVREPNVDPPPFSPKTRLNTVLPDGSALYHSKRLMSEDVRFSRKQLATIVTDASFLSGSSVDAPYSLLDMNVTQLYHILYNSDGSTSYFLPRGFDVGQPIATPATI